MIIGIWGCLNRQCPGATIRKLDYLRLRVRYLVVLASLSHLLRRREQRREGVGEPRVILDRRNIRDPLHVLSTDQATNQVVVFKRHRNNHKSGVGRVEQIDLSDSVKPEHKIKHTRNIYTRNSSNQATRQLRCRRGNLTPKHRGTKKLNTDKPRATELRLLIENNLKKREY